MCHCAAFPANDHEAELMKERTASYEKTVVDIAKSGRYNTRKDFSVIHQPIFNTENSFPSEVCNQLIPVQIHA